MLLYGHRGAKGEAPENTLAGFAYALGLGIDAFELDIRLAADERLVVMHDATVDRTTNGSGRVADLTSTELSELDARADFPDWPEQVWVPALDEIFSTFPEVGRWELEVKTDSPERLARICELLAPMISHYGLGGRVTVSSFDPVALEQIAAVAPHLPRGFIGAYDAPAFLATALRLGCAQADIPIITGSAEMVRAAHAAGLRVTGWPGNTPDAIRTLIAWGVDHITTDYPKMALEVVG